MPSKGSTKDTLKHWVSVSCAPLYIFYKFEVVAGFFVVEEFGALGYLPYVRIDPREEGVCRFDDRMYMSYDKAVYQRKGLGVDLATANDEAAFQVGLFCHIECRLKGSRHSNLLSCAEATGNDYVDPLRKRTAYGLEGLAAHDHRAAEGGALEELKIFGDVPKELVVASDCIVIRDRYYYTFFHNVHFTDSCAFAPATSSISHVATLLAMT